MMNEVKYPEYEQCKRKYSDLQKAFVRILLEKEKLITQTMPRAIQYGKDKVDNNIDDNPLEDYVISVEEKDLDRKISKLRRHMMDWKLLLDAKEEELRASAAVLDRVYVSRYLDGLSINQIGRLLNYSRPQIYRKLSQIQKNLRQNETPNVI